MYTIFHAQAVYPKPQKPQSNVPHDAHAIASKSVPPRVTLSDHLVGQRHLGLS